MADNPTELSSLMQGFMSENDRMEKYISNLNEKLNKLCPAPGVPVREREEVKQNDIGQGVVRDKTFIDSLREEVNRKGRLVERLSDSINHLSQII